MFSDILQRLRKQSRLTQEELAARLSVPVRTYGSWERNERQPSFEVLTSIADFFNVSTDYLLGRTDEPYFSRRIDGDTAVLATQKELSDVSAEEPTVRTDVDVNLDALPKDRKELEQFVLDLLHKAGEEQHTD